MTIFPKSKTVKALSIILLLFLLFATNPSKEDFNYRFAKSDYKLINSVANNISDAITTRNEYFIFSVYTVNFGFKEYKYLGIFKTFLKIQE